MTIIEKIDLLMDLKGIKNKSQLSELSGIPYTTIVGLYEKGNENVRRSTLIKFSKFFRCSLDYIAIDEITDINYGKADGFKVSYNEMNFIKKYRELDAHGKEIVDSVLDMERKRNNDQNPIKRVPLQDTDIELELARYRKELEAEKGDQISSVSEELGEA